MKINIVNKEIRYNSMILIVKKTDDLNRSALNE